MAADNNMNFWVEAQKTVRFMADKHWEHKLLNFEVTMYAQICSALEKHFQIIATQFDTTIEQIRNNYDAIIDEDEEEDDEFGPSTSVS